MKFLDELPLASLLGIVAAVIGGVIVIVSPDTLSWDQYVKSLGFLLGGAGVLGIARAQSGKGVRK